MKTFFTNRLYITLTIYILVTDCAPTEIDGKDYVDVFVARSTNEFVLPQPFGRSRIIIDSDRGKIVAFNIETESVSVSIDQKIIGDVDYNDLPEITYARSNQDNRSPIDSFNVTFEIGLPDTIQLSDVPGCADPCIITERDMLVLEIDRNGDVHSTVIDVAASLRREGENWPRQSQEDEKLQP